MMKQKIVIKAQMICKKCKTKALTIATGASGVNSVSIQGETQLVVIGLDVDPIALTNSLRKKVGLAMLISVEDVKDQKPEDQKNGGGKPNGDNKLGKESNGGGGGGGKDLKKANGGDQSNGCCGGCKTKKEEAGNGNGNGNGNKKKGEDSKPKTAEAAAGFTSYPAPPCQSYYYPQPQYPSYPYHYQPHRYYGVP